ncbi:MAG TPA: apolipoprotein N-acyltransferase [Polyangiaceae bacterium]
MTRGARIALSAVGGAMLGLATPPIDFFAAAFVGEALFACALFHDDAKPKRPWAAGALRGWLFGTAVNIAVLRFAPSTIVRFTDLPWGVALLALVLLGMFQGLRWLVCGWLTMQLRMRRVPGFLAFGIATWVSTFVPGVFAWTVASGLSPMRALVQLADVVGERGVSALIAIFCAFFAEAVYAAFARDRRRLLQYASIGAAIPLAMTIAGVLRIRAIEDARKHAPHVRVALAEPSTDARIRWEASAADDIMRRLTMLTIAAEQRGTDLVVWPEAAYPYTMSATQKNDFVGPHAVLQPGVRGPVLTGVIMRAKDGELNAATIVDERGVAPAYAKMHLLAFGEEVPFSETFPALRRAFVRGTGLVPGHHQVALVSGRIRAAVLNCFEDTLPEAGLEAIGVDPNLLVNVTNDAWFVETQESELHLRVGAMRAIELRRDLVRAVNEGVTSWVDATGAVCARYVGPVAGTLPTTPALLEGKTIYARLGDWAGVLLLGLLAAATWLGARQKQNGAPR